jgi:flagellar biosynthesis chaperone FliJ
MLKPTERQIRQAHKEYVEQSQPYIQILIDIENVCIHQMFISTTGETMVHKQYTIKQQEIIDEVYKHLMELKEMICKKYGIEP